MRKVLLIIIGVVVVVCGVGGFFVYRAVDTGRQISKSSISQEQFDAQKVGTAEATVRDALPVPLPDTKDKDIYGNDDPTQQDKPAGAACTYYAVKPVTKSGDRPLFRFCFAGAKLVQKKQIRIAGV
jgi:hypothetical protein